MTRSRHATMPRRGRSPASPPRPRQRNRTWSSMSATTTIARTPAPDDNPKCAGQSVGIWLGRMERRFFCTGARSARRRALGLRARQPRILPPRRTGLVALSRSASAGQRARLQRCGQRRPRRLQRPLYGAAVRRYAADRVRFLARRASRRCAVDDPMYCDLLAADAARAASSLAAPHTIFSSITIRSSASPPIAARRPAGVYPGNAALQSVLAASNGPLLFPADIDALLAGHNHLFEAVSFATGASAAVHFRQRRRLARRAAAAAVAAGRDAVRAMPSSRRSRSTATFGFVILQRDAGSAAAWRVEAWDRDGRLLTRCVLRERRTTLRAGGSAVKRLAMSRAALIAACDALRAGARAAALFDRATRRGARRLANGAACVEQAADRVHAGRRRGRRRVAGERTMLGVDPGLADRFRSARLSAAVVALESTQPIPGADTRERRSEDSPARVMVSFSGNPASLRRQRSRRRAPWPRRSRATRCRTRC